MQQSRTLPWPESSTYITTFFNHLQETSWRNKTPWSKKQTCLRNVSQSSKNACSSRLLSCRFPLRLWLPAHFLPILLHHFFSFCHILLWLLCIILLIPIFPFHFVFPTSSVRAWPVICDWFDDVTCACAAGLYRPRWRPPGNPRIIRAVNFEPADVNCVVDRHVVWEI